MMFCRAKLNSIILCASAPLAPGLGQFPCKPAGSGGQPGAEGQPYCWDTLNAGDI